MCGSFWKLLSAADAEGKEIILKGDTYCNLKDHRNRCTKSIKSIYSEFQFEQQIEYTRVITEEKDGGSHSSRTLIDHFATNLLNYILRANVLKLGMVDHYLIFAVRKINAKRLLNKQTQIAETRSLRSYDKQLFLDELSTIDWDKTLASTNGNPDLVASVFNSVISALLEVHTPLKRTKLTSHHAPWITADLKNLLKRRDLATTKSEKDPSYCSEHKKLRTKVTHELRKRVQEYYHNLVDETQNKPKAMWKTLNKVLHNNSSYTVTQNIILEGTELKTPLQISEVFNKDFTTVGPKLAEKVISQPLDDPLRYLGNEINNARFTLETVRVAYVERAIRALNKSKSPGADRIPVETLRDAVHFVSQSLTLIYNASLKMGIFRQIWKLAIVTPIYKTGSKADVKNYRPISVFSAASMILEKIVHYQLMEYLKGYNKLCLNQFAFQNLYNTVTCLLNIIDPWLKSSDEGEMNLSIFLDLRKAYDTVDHTTLLLKLGKYGIRSTSYNWFTSCLTNREQFCHLDNSSRDILKFGIPHGSCLGPLLFLLHVNDFENCLEYMTPNGYADDTCVTIASENLDDQITDVKNELETISNWMRINKPSLNASKSEFMVVRH